MLEIKNDSKLPVSLLLSPMQKHYSSIDKNLHTCGRESVKPTEIMIPAGDSHKNNSSTCTMRMSVSRLSTLVWKGVIPTCTSYPIIINSDGLPTHNGIPLVNTINSSNFISSYGIYILATILVIACMWYCKRKASK